jgi:hypothetical protein
MTLETNDGELRSVLSLRQRQDIKKLLHTELFEPLFLEVNGRCHNAELRGITQQDFIINRNGVHVGGRACKVF